MNLKNFYKDKKFWVRLSSIILLVFIAIILFLTGKQHQFLLDNNNYDENGKTYAALSLCEVQIDRRPSVEIPRRTRMESYALGQSHKITVQYNGKTVTEKFKVPVGITQFLINIPALVNGESQETWLTEFRSGAPQVVEEAFIEEEESTIDMGSF